jgi:NADH:ubiquinone oxidoreductase subunit
MSFGTSLYTWLYGNLVGEDDKKNKYYCDSKNFKDLSAKRWVMFKSDIESSKIPSHWHAWLHKSIDIPPINYKHKYEWQKEHQENMTGTDQAYYPDSHPLSKSHNNKAIKSEYESWSP